MKRIRKTLLHLIHGHRFGPWVDVVDEKVEDAASFSFYVNARVESLLVNGKLRSTVTYRCRECELCGKVEIADREATYG